MNTFKIGEDNSTLPAIELGDKVQLAKQTQDVIACQETGVKMLNIDAKELAPGDLKFIKSLGLTISNPDTDKPVALGVDYVPESFGHKLAKFFESDTTDNDDDTEDDNDDDSFSSHNDSGFFSSGGLFGGGFSGGFGGFGGGSFGGAGASAGF